MARRDKVTEAQSKRRHKVTKAQRHKVKERLSAAIFFIIHDAQEPVIETNSRIQNNTVVGWGGDGVGSPANESCQAAHLRFAAWPTYYILNPEYWLLFLYKNLEHT